MLTPRISRLSIGALALAASLTTAVSANATAITSTTYSAWTASLTGSPSEANMSAISLTSYNTASGLTLASTTDSTVAFTFTGPDNGGYAMTGTTFAGTKSLAGSSDAGAGLNVAMPTAGVNAFLLSVGTTGNTPLTLTLSDGETFALSSGLFGISISHPISSFLLTTSAGSEAVIDDFYYGVSDITQDPTGGSGTPGANEPVAEVATSLMMAGGFLFLFGAWRKFGTPAAH